MRANRQMLNEVLEVAVHDTHMSVPLIDTGMVRVIGPAALVALMMGSPHWHQQSDRRDHSSGGARVAAEAAEVGSYEYLGARYAAQCIVDTF